MQLTERERRLLRLTFVDFQNTFDFIDNPLIVARAEGLYYWDKEGKRYFDGISGIYVATLGHRHPRLIEALERQAQKLTFAPTLHAVSDVALDFIEKLGSVTPADLNFIKTFSGGSLSIESAIKFTRQYFQQIGQPNKHKFISRYQSYHGATFGAMALTGNGRNRTPFEPGLGGFPKIFHPAYYRDQFSSWEQCNRVAAQTLEDVILYEDPNSVAGFVVEPIGNTGGIITPTEEYLQIIRDICDRYNVKLIFDEIITGFGRTGSMFAAQTFGVTPDIICSGKGLGSGVVPLGAMMAREEMGDVFFGPEDEKGHFAHGHTYAGNPLAAAVGIAVIDEIVEKQLAEKARERGDYLAGKLEGLKQYGVVREVRGKGLLRGVEIVRDTDSMKPFPELGKALKKTSLENGVIMRIDPQWFSLAPPLIVEKQDLDELFDLVERSLVQALEQVTTSV